MPSSSKTIKQIKKRPTNGQEGWEGRTLLEEAGRNNDGSLGGCGTFLLQSLRRKTFEKEVSVASKLEEEHDVHQEKHNQTQR
jgi:hypothetical protein